MQIDALEIRLDSVDVDAIDECDEVGVESVLEDLLHDRLPLIDADLMIRCLPV